MSELEQDVFGIVIVPTQKTSDFPYRFEEGLPILFLDFFSIEVKSPSPISPDTPPSPPIASELCLGDMSKSLSEEKSC